MSEACRSYAFVGILQGNGDVMKEFEAVFEFKALDSGISLVYHNPIHRVIKDLDCSHANNLKRKKIHILSNHHITKTCLCKMQQYLKAEIFLDENNDIFLIFDQNLDCGYV